MRVIEVANGVSGYWQLLAKVLERGEKRVPRGLPTLDLGPTTVVMHDTDHPLPLQTGRNLSRKIAAVVANGRYFDRAALDRLLVEAAAGWRQVEEMKRQAKTKRPAGRNP